MTKLRRLAVIAARDVEGHRMLFALTDAGVASVFVFAYGSDAEALRALGVTEASHVLASDAPLDDLPVIAPSDEERRALAAACDWDVRILLGSRMSGVEGAPECEDGPPFGDPSPFDDPYPDR